MPTLIEEGLALHHQGHLDEAAACYREALRLDRKDLNARYLLGAIALQNGEFHEAIHQMETVIAVQPSADAYSNVGLAAKSLGDLPRAIAAYEKAIELAPGNAAIISNLGIALHAAGRYQEARRAFARAIANAPGHPEALTNYANLLISMGLYGEAIERAERALVAQPAFIRARIALAAALHRMGRTAEAEREYGRILFDEPTNVVALAGRAAIFTDSGRLAEARDDYQALVDVAPDAPMMLGCLYYTKMRMCDWRGAAELAERIRQAIAAGVPAAHPFHMMISDLSEEDFFRLATLYARSSFTKPRNPVAPYRHDRIRLGFFAADFHEHPTSHLAIELFEQIGRTRFEVSAFSFGPETEDAMRHRLLMAFDHFYSVQKLSDADIAQAARELEIDIAFDLNGVTANGRPGIFIEGAAPIQVGYLGYPGTSGGDWLDYVLTDNHLVPEDQQKFYSEKIAYMPVPLQINSSRPLVGGLTRDRCGLPETGFVFACFNQNSKISPWMFDCWMQILSRVEGSVLWLTGDNVWSIENLRREAEAHGIAGGRLIFAPRSGRFDHLARHRLVDLCLDTLPYGGHTTTSDALWMGTPVLTIVGKTHVGRVASGLLMTAGSGWFIAKDLYYYEQMAVDIGNGELQLARDNDWRSSPIFDTDRYTRHFEAACESLLSKSSAS